MKTKDFNKILENYPLGIEKVEILKSVFKKTKKQRNAASIIASVLSVTTIILIILLCLTKCESDKTIVGLETTISNQEKEINNLKIENDSLKIDLLDVNNDMDCLEEENRILRERVSYVENMKPILLVTKITRYLEGKQIIKVDAVMAPNSSKYKSHATFEHEICNSDSLEAENESLKMELEFDNDVLEVALDLLETIGKDSVEVVMTKENPNASWEILRAQAAYQDLLDIPVNPVIQGGHVFTEYWDNPYRLKKERAFKRALGSAVGSVAFYSLTEIMGHPIYTDYSDNTEAELKSATIKGLRIVSGVLGAYSVFEFARTWHFHKMEGKYIISPTEIGVSINLNSKK